MNFTIPDIENIQRNTAYPDSKSRAEKMLLIFSKSEQFCREKLAEHLNNIGLLDLANVVKTGEYRV